MIQSTLTNTMSVAELAPKAATRLPETRSGNAFGEALAGAHTVHDKREARDSAPGRERSQIARSTDRAGDRSNDQDSGGARSVDRSANATDKSTEPGGARDAANPGRSQRSDGSTQSSSPTGADDRTELSTEIAADATLDVSDASGATDVVAEADATASAAVTVAVSAAPVAVDLDAIIVPTAAATTAAATSSTDAIDAAMRLAIDASTQEAAVEVADDGAPRVAAQAAHVDAAISDDGEAAPVIATTTKATLPGAEDVETGDVQAGPKLPSTSTLAQTSGPSPAQLAAATFQSQTIDVEADAAATTKLGLEVAAAPVVDLAAGDQSDAGATRLIQAAVVDAEVDTELETPNLATTGAAGKSIAVTADADSSIAGDAEIIDADAPQVAQVARNMQGQSATVAANAQFQAAAQAKSAEKAAEEGAGEAAPVKAEPAQPAQLQATPARSETVQPGIRVREGLLNASVQHRIDHIAEQLATRLKMSHAAGGSLVQLNLKPRELGEVAVQMTIRDGVVAATVLVDRADTMRTLETNLEELKRSLEGQGLKIDEFSVDVRGEAGAGGANARAAADMHRNGSAGGRSSRNAAASIAGAASATPGLSGDREVDADSLHDGDVSVLA